MKDVFDKDKNVPGKPRLAEVLGVEVGERFRVDMGYAQTAEFYIGPTGDIHWGSEDGRVLYASYLCHAINHPELIIRAPRLTEPELAIMRDCGAKWVSRGDVTTSLALLWEVEPRKYPDGVFRLCWYNPIAEVDPRLFPSVHPGECIAVENI